MFRILSWIRNAWASVSFRTSSEGTFVEEQKVLAENGIASAQFLLGGAYSEGFGVPKDEAEAVKWYRKAAEQGLVVAQHSLGMAYAQGQGVPKDEAEAVKWYRKAAEQGWYPAQVHVSQAYFLGKGVPQDWVQAYMWFLITSRQGNVVSREVIHGLESTLTAEQLAEGRKMAREFKPTGP